MEEPLGEGAPVWVAAPEFAVLAERPYVEATVVELTDDAYVLEPAANPAQTLRKKPHEVFAANAELEAAPEDMCGLLHLNEPTLLHATAKRAAFGATYTWVGASQLLSVNPCEPVEGGEQLMTFFRNKTREIGEAEPHAYAVAEAACARLHRQRRVAVLVSGESGAGKTEASRLVVQYLVWRAAHTEARSAAHAADNARAGKLREGVLASNTVLESLGNARMVANANSSRFGKHVLLLVEPASSADSPISLRGAEIECFLLERCRLCAIAPAERNFHALYYLLAAGARQSTFGGGGGSAAQRLADGRGGLPREFAYLCSTVERGLEPEGAPPRGASSAALQNARSGEAASTDAAVAAAVEGHRRLHEAFAVLGVSERGEQALYRLMRGVLLLGQLEFRDAERPADPPLACDPNTVAAVSSVLGEDVLAQLLEVSIASPRSGASIRRENSAEQARSARDSLAMALYQAVFDAALRFVNAVLAPSDAAAADGTAASRGIALLDVFGFEVLPTNSLEQLLINYTNEKLHEHFLRCTLREEERVYAAEGLGAFVPPAAAVPATSLSSSPTAPRSSSAASPVPKAKPPAKDNEALLRLLEGRPSGLLSCLESTCRLPNGNDTGFVRDLFASNDRARKENTLRPPRNAAAIAGRRALKPDEGFQLAHFHSAVQYDAHAFVAKNRDVLSVSLAAAVERQAAALWRELSAGSSLAADGGGGGGDGVKPLALRRGGKAPTSLSEGHRTRLAKLLGDLDPEASGVHNFFIKCVKPNERMKPGVFHGGYSLRQLRHQGVLQAVAIIKEGFPHRVSYAEVHTRYAPLLQALAAQNRPGTRTFASIGPRGLVCALLAAEELTETVDYVLGRTRVFLRLGKAQLLERMLSLPPREVLPDLEKRLHAHATRVRARMMLRLAVRRGVARRRLRKEREAKAAVAMQSRARRAAAKKRVRRVRQQREAEAAAAVAEVEAKVRRAEEAAAREAAEAAAAVRRAEEEEARAWDEAAVASVLPHMPSFYALSREATATSAPTDLALDPSLHQLLFAHWDWSAPGAGEGASANAMRPRRAMLAGRGAVSKVNGIPPSSRREGRTNGPLSAVPGGAGMLGWAIIAAIAGAYVVVASLPLLHYVGFMPNHWVFWPSSPAGATR